MSTTERVRSGPTVGSAVLAAARERAPLTPPPCAAAPRTGDRSLLPALPLPGGARRATAVEEGGRGPAAGQRASAPIGEQEG